MALIIVDVGISVPHIPLLSYPLQVLLLLRRYHYRYTKPYGLNGIAKEMLQTDSDSAFGIQTQGWNVPYLYLQLHRQVKITAVIITYGCLL